MTDRDVPFRRSDGVGGHFVSDGIPRFFVELGKGFTFGPDDSADILMGEAGIQNGWSEMLEEANRRIAETSDDHGKQAEILLAHLQSSK